jgi:hypothetical protein
MCVYVSVCVVCVCVRFIRAFLLFFTRFLKREASFAAIELSIASAIEAMDSRSPEAIDNSIAANDASRFKSRVKKRRKALVSIRSDCSFILCNVGKVSPSTCRRPIRDRGHLRSVLLPPLPEATSLHPDSWRRALLSAGCCDPRYCRAMGVHAWWCFPPTDG